MKQRRKTFWVLLFAVMLIVINSVKIGLVKASPTRVSVDYFGTNEIFDTQLVPNTEFTVNLTVDYVEELWGYQFTFVFNPDVIHGVSVENGPFLGSAGGTVMVASGSGFDNVKGKLALFAAALYPKSKFPTGGGVLAILKFRVVGYGESPIRFSINSGLSDKTASWIIHLSELVWSTPNQTYVPKDPPHTPEAFIHGIFDNRPPLYVYPSRVIGVPKGETFSVNVSVADMEDVNSWTFHLNWTASLLNLTGVAEGDFGSFLYEIDNEAGYLHIGSSTSVTNSGSLANITFLVEDLGKSNLTLYNVEMLNSTNHNIPIRTRNGFFNNYVHDISILDITPYPTGVRFGSGDLISINVTLRNSGAFKETGINLTTYYEQNQIDNQAGISLEIGELETFTFTWNTTGIPIGKYKIIAVVDPVVNETDIADNTYSYRGGWVTIFVRNIAITSITAPITKAFQGQSVIISVLVVNKGTQIEDFNVTAYLITSNNDEQAIQTQPVKELGYLENRLLRFYWNTTTDVILGSYAIKAVASPVEDESNLTDNTFVKVERLQVVAFVTEFPTELAALSLAVCATIAVLVVFLVRRRKPAEAIEEEPPGGITV